MSFQNRKIEILEKFGFLNDTDGSGLSNNISDLCLVYVGLTIY